MRVREQLLELEPIALPCGTLPLENWKASMLQVTNKDDARGGLILLQV
jgi:hypothetical protein